MTVYVVQRHMRWDEVQNDFVDRFDLGPAQEYGEVKFLLGPTAKPFNSGPIIDELNQKLEGFTAEDYLLLIGNPCLIGMAVAVASQKSGGPVKMLQWTKATKTYGEIKARF